MDKIKLMNQLQRADSLIKKTQNSARMIGANALAETLNDPIREILTVYTELHTELIKDRLLGSMLDSEAPWHSEK